MMNISPVTQLNNSPISKQFFAIHLIDSIFSIASIVKLLQDTASEV